MFAQLQQHVFVPCDNFMLRARSIARKLKLKGAIKIEIIQLLSEKYGSFYIPGKLSTYPSLKPTFCPKWEVSVNVGFGEGYMYVGSFPEMFNDPILFLEGISQGDTKWQIVFQ